MENSINFSKSLSLVDFILDQGANTIKIIRNPHTSKRFFVVEGTEVTGRVSNKVEKLSADLRVSWMEPADGDASYIIHPRGEGGDANTLDTFSAR